MPFGLLNRIKVGDTSMVLSAFRSAHADKYPNPLSEHENHPQMTSRDGKREKREDCTKNGHKNVTEMQNNSIIRRNFIQ